MNTIATHSPATHSQSTQADMSASVQATQKKDMRVATKATDSAKKSPTVQEHTLTLGADIITSIARISSSLGRDADAASGLKKMTEGVALMGAVYSAAEALSPELMLFLEDSKSNSETIDMGKKNVASRLDEHKKAVKSKISAIKKQAKSKKKKGFWGKLKSICKAIAKVALVVGAVLSGGTLAVIGAGLMIASMITSKLKGNFAKYLTMGLSVASIVFGGVGAFASGGQAFAGISEGIAKVTEVVGAGTGVAGGIAAGKEETHNDAITKRAADILQVETRIDELFSNIEDTVASLKDAYSGIATSAQQASQRLKDSHVTQNTTVEKLDE